MTLHATNHGLNKDNVEYWWVIPLLESGRLIGQVYLVGEGWFKISPYVKGLPTETGEAASSFFAPYRLNPGIEVQMGDWVSFYWQEPGKRGRNQDGQLADPIAVDAELIHPADLETEKDELMRRLQDGLKAQVEEKINKLVEEREKDALDLRQKAEDKLKQAEENEKALEIEKQSLENEKETLTAKEQSLEIKEDELEKKEEELEEYYESKIKPLEHLLPRETTTVKVHREKTELRKIRAEWQNALESARLNLPKDVGLSFLLSSLTACLTGSLVLLSGPVGTGKSKIIRTAAKVLDGGAEVVPVRPGWLDSSDLLGFYDPLRNTYSPTPFANGLVKAKTLSDRLFFLALDELNLARIEDYGADLLSVLEYSKNQTEGEHGQIQLYAQDVEARLKRELHFLLEEQIVLESENQELPMEKKIRLEELAVLLNSYPANLQVPENLVLLGTLNADETTYDLSPKVIDRSYVIAFPPAKLESFLNTARGEDVYLPLSVSELQAAATTAPLNADYEQYWQELLDWYKLYLEPVILPLGHRIKRDFRVFGNVAHLLGVHQRDAFRCFIFTKILPRIKFFKDEEGVKQQKLTDWLENEQVKVYLSPSARLVVAWLQGQMKDESRPLVSYWR